jgi:hypothetical protein
MENLQRALRDNHELAARVVEAENKLLRESLDALCRYVDPLDALRGERGELWPLLGEDDDARAADGAFADERQLAEARAEGRRLERSNEFAINGHENRVSYIVGAGHTYKALAKKGAVVSEELVADAQRAIDEFVRVNRWQHRQQEIVRRKDRDGEAFLRLFVDAEGVTRVRFVEPGQVYRPTRLAHSAASSFGVETDPRDVETVYGYWIDGAWVDASEVQHRKQGVDANVKRGVPLFYPVRDNLRRAEKLLRNMAAVADIQTAIAMIRRHERAPQSAAETFRAQMATATVADGAGATTYFQRYAPGTILDVPKTIDYDFPAAGLDASRYVVVLQAILRSVASRLVFPEFMLTSDASNANYSSTLVAEGPAVKMFERWQADMKHDDLDILRRALDAAVRAGRLPSEALEQVEIHVGLPRVATRDAKQEAEVNAVYHRLGVKSPQTIAAELGLDHAQERANFQA